MNFLMDNLCEKKVLHVHKEIQSLIIAILLLLYAVSKTKHTTKNTSDVK